MEGLLACCACPQGPALSQAWRYEQSRLSARTWSLQAGCEWLVWACCDRRPPSTLWGFAPKGILLAVHAIAARMAAQRGLGLFRAAEESSRSTVEAGQPPCASACALEALQSSQTASSQPRARQPSRTSSSRAPCRRQVLGVNRGRKSDFRKTIARSLSSSLGYITMQKAHPLRTQGVDGSDSSILIERR